MNDYQLTTWCKTKEELQFAIDQVEKYGDEAYFRSCKTLDKDRHRFVDEYAVFRKNFALIRRESIC